MDTLYTIAGNATYGTLAFTAYWGIYCGIVAWTLSGKKSFKSETIQDEFLDQVDMHLARGDMDGATALCEGESRALPQLISYTIAKRGIGFSKVKGLALDRFQREIMGQMDYYMSWVLTMIKTAPMWGLLGTVLGMMGAFGQLASAETVKASALAGNISLALLTTAIGLMICIPLMMVVNLVNVRIRTMDELVTVGMNRFLDSLQKCMSQRA